MSGIMLGNLIGSHVSKANQNFMGASLYDLRDKMLTRISTGGTHPHFAVQFLGASPDLQAWAAMEA